MYKFVIVDDDDIVCESISSTIDWEHFRFDEPVVFSNCADALEYLQNHRTDVVMTNIHMEPISGIELAQQRNEFSEQTLVVFFTDSQAKQSHITKFFPQVRRELIVLVNLLSNRCNLLCTECCD